MFGLSWFEFFIILVVALVVIGPDKLPEVARGLARVIRQVQRMVGEVRDSIQMEDLEAKMRDSSHYTPPSSTSRSPATVEHPEAAHLQESDGVSTPPIRQPASAEPAPSAATTNKTDPTRP